MRILAITSKHSGVGYHRIMMPLVHLEKEYAMVTDTISHEMVDNNYDILLINRVLNNVEVETICELRKQYGFKLVVDNDDFWELDAHHVLYDTYNQLGIVDRIKGFIREADLCTCTHERLADEIYKLNTNVHILPNALPYGREQFLDNKVDSDKVRLFWSGSATHEHDLAILKNPMKRLIGMPIKTVVAGYNEIEKHLWDRMIASFTCSLRLNPTIYNYNEVTKYMAAYADSDISIIPLQETKFTGMKSNLKVLETASKKNPAIVSHVNPYLNLPVHYVKKQSDWFKHIKDLVNDEQMRIESGNQLFEYCNKHFNFDVINSKRKDIYQQIL
jgi:hypothetical protein